MRWRGREQSENVRDNRGAKGKKMAAGGGAGMLIVVVIALLFGKDKAQQFAQIQQRMGQNNAQPQEGAGAGIDDDSAEFIRVVLRDTETVWAEQFRSKTNVEYRKPVLNMFSNQTLSGCGQQSSAMGPFYCPADEQIYIDPTFFNQLELRHNSEGDFARAFVIAHEVAHHIQNVLGWNRPLGAARSKGDKRLINQESVRLELQADYLAGVWAHHIEKHARVLESGDLQEAMNAAFQIGDDTLQRQATGKVVPASFTHGSGKQRQRWFREGVHTGDFTKAVRITGSSLGGPRIAYRDL